MLRRPHSGLPQCTLTFPGLLLQTEDARGLGFCQIATSRRSQAEGIKVAPNLTGRGSYVTAKFQEARVLHATSLCRLTPREIECLEWLGRGLRVGGISRKLGIASTTVVTHLSGARKKLGVATREQALVLALRHGLIDP